MVKERLYIEYDGVTFDLNLRGHVVVIRGDSGTGKTFLWNTVNIIKNSGFGRFTEDLKNVEIINWENRGAYSIEALKTYKNKLIIIDNASCFITQEIADFIADDTQNQYLIFTRDAGVTFHISPNYLGDFVSNGNRISIEYRSSRTGWF